MVLVISLPLLLGWPAPPLLLGWLAPPLLLGWLAPPWPFVSAAEPEIPILEITSNTRLEPGKTYGALVIKASGITIDGTDAWLVGPGRETVASFQGVGVFAKGVRGVTFRNLRARGFETGLRLVDCQDCRIEGCDFSHNFHDPAFGWGENGRRGGMVLEQCRGLRLERNRANQVWDACVLVDSDLNTLVHNDFSHTSNTCLKLWHASRNLVQDNVLSHGIRKDPGEVHARDSTSVLIESGSNDNRFVRNDCTHGGDGIFIRVLNGWVSTGNHFEENDCSYANNNCFEAWSPRNTYIRNKANHGSYGFWLGASDQTVLIDNEASYNGLPDGPHNSPHLPDRGHAGIVFMFGSSSHTVVRGNRCVGNNGAGIALLGDEATQGKKFRAHHWILERNWLEGNRWGIFAKHADWLDLAGNVLSHNREAGFFDAGGITHVAHHPDRNDITTTPRARLLAPQTVRVGEPVVFDATASTDPSGRPLSFRWFLGEGTWVTLPRFEHRFSRPGFHRVGLTVNNGRFSDLAWRDLYVVQEGSEEATEGSAEKWGFVDPQSQVTFHADRVQRIAGEVSIHALVQPYGGQRVSLEYPRDHQANWSLAGKTHLVFWLKTRNENIPAWQDANPLVTLFGRDGAKVEYRPRTDLLGQPAETEAREGWTFIRVPLASDVDWKRTGESVESLQWLSLGFDSWGAPPLEIWIDGLSFTTEAPESWAES
jgi:parallel beta-helix repeat protein